MNGRRVPPIFLLPIGTAAWWWACWTLPATRHLFFPVGAWEAQADSILAADAVLLVFGGTCAGVSSLRGHASSRTLNGVVLGGCLYGTIIALEWFVRDPSCWASPLAMLAACALVIRELRHP